MEGKITLEGMEFFAHHGYYQEEQKIGNKFAVDITVVTDLSDAAEHDVLKETIDYESLYKIIRHVMSEPTKLLEHLGKRIIDTVFEEFQQVSSVEVKVSKYNPPVGGICQRASVSLKENRQ
ncbi:MAG: dihydroneopterin aldolase [Cyclobacteriaceae bacterium]|jgi:dihydroneopterin aldolase